MKQPLGFRSKRQYRQESVYGYQDVKKQDRRREENFQYLIEVFGDMGTNEDGDHFADGYVLSPDPKKIEQNFRDIARFDAEIASWRQDQQ